MFSINILSSAEQGIADAYNFIAFGSPKGAKKWYRNLKETIANLLEMPKQCPVLKEGFAFGLEVRQMIFGKKRSSYRVFYTIVEKRQKIIILAVRRCYMQQTEEYKLEEGK